MRKIYILIGKDEKAKDYLKTKESNEIWFFDEVTAYSVASLFTSASVFGTIGVEEKEVTEEWIKANDFR